MSPYLDLSIFPLFLTNNAKFTYDLFSRKTYETPYVGRYVIMEHPMKMGISLRNILLSYMYTCRLGRAVIMLFLEYQKVRTPESCQYMLD